MIKKIIRFVAGLLFLTLLFSCEMFSDGDSNNDDKLTSLLLMGLKVSGVQFDKNKLNIIEGGESEYLTLILKPNGIQELLGLSVINVKWDYDKEMIDLKGDNFGAIIQGRKPGQTYIKASCNGIIATCIVKIESAESAGILPYIYSDNAVLEMMPGNTTNITVSLYGGTVTDMENFIWKVKDENICTVETSRNHGIVKTLKNGSTQITVSHPKAKYDYTFIVFVYQDKLNTTYITTDSNVVSIDKSKTKSVNISVDLVNPLNSFYKQGFTWDYADGESKNIVKVNASLNIAELIPLKSGLAKLKITHENAEYPLEILVRVITIVQNVYITVSPSTMVINGSDDYHTVTANLENYSDLVDNDTFEWEIPPETKDLCESCTVSGNSVTIRGKKNGKFYLKVSHEKSETSRTVLVILQEQIESAINASWYITSPKNFYQAVINEPLTISAFLYGSTGDDENDFTWKLTDKDMKKRYTDIATVEAFTGNISTDSRSIIYANETHSTGTLTLNPCGVGTLKIEVGHEKCLYPYTIFMKTYSTLEELQADEVKYLYTDRNAVVFESAGDSTSLEVGGVNMSELELMNNSWTMTDTERQDEDKPNFTMNTYSSGIKADITALHPGKSKITVNNPDSMAPDIEFYLKCGSLLEWKDEYITYIETNSDVVNIVKNGDRYNLQAMLVNSSEKTGWNFKYLKGEENTEITMTSQGLFSIKGVEAGQSVIQISNSNCEEGIVKDVLINVANSIEELSALVYLTTSQNVLNVGLSSSVTCNVNLVNGTLSDYLTGWRWAVKNNSIATITPTNNSAYITGLKTGTTVIQVSNSFIEYTATNPLEIILNVVDLDVAANDPFISCNNITTCTANSSAVTISAELIGGNQSDETGFSWNLVNPSDTQYINLNYSGNNAVVKGLKEGAVQIQISHSKAGVVPRIILVVIESEKKDNCYISLTDSIVKMSPLEGEKTITATLINGTDEDNYDFVWWADNYDFIDMKYTNNYCVVKPIKTGSVTIHVSHKKASNEKVVLLNISQYDEFAFADTHIELENGEQTFVEMQVPLTNVSAICRYTTSNNNVSVEGSSGNICSITANSIGSSIVTAYLVQKSNNNVVLAGPVELLVTVTKKDSNLLHFSVMPSSYPVVFDGNGQSKSFSAKVIGNGNFNDENYIKWIIPVESSPMLEFTSKSGVNTNADGSSFTFGKEVKISSKTSGYATVKLEHEGVVSKTILCSVSGTTDPIVMLNATSLTCFAGDSSTKVIASITNEPDDSVIEWTYYLPGDIDGEWIEAEKDIVETEGNGLCVAVQPMPGNNKIVNIIPYEAGKIKIKASLKDYLGSFEECIVNVIQNPKFTFYLDEDYTQPITELKIIPNQTKQFWYKLEPETELIEKIKAENNLYWEFTEVKKDEYGRIPNKGCVNVVGRPYSEGSADIVFKTFSSVEQTLRITNGYMDNFVLYTSAITSSPKADSDNFEIEYSVRPYTSKLHVYIAKKDRRDNHVMSGVSLIYPPVSPIERNDVNIYAYTNNLTGKYDEYIIDVENECKEGRSFRDKLTEICRGSFKINNIGQNLGEIWVVQSHDKFFSDVQADGAKGVDTPIKKISVPYAVHYTSYKDAFELSGVSYNYYDDNGQKKGVSNNSFSYLNTKNRLLRLGDGESVSFNIEPSNSHRYMFVNKNDFYASNSDYNGFYWYGSTPGSINKGTSETTESYYAELNEKSFHLNHISSSTGGFSQIGISGNVIQKNTEKYNKYYSVEMISRYDFYAYPDYETAKNYYPSYLDKASFVTEGINRNARLNLYIGDLICSYIDYNGTTCSNFNNYSYSQQYVEIPVYFELRNCKSDSNE